MWSVTWSVNSFAVGLGFTLGYGAEEWEDADTAFSDVEEDRDLSHFGFLFETVTAANHSFNYRFTLAREKNKGKKGSADIRGTVMTHDFGFALYRNRWTRVWAGPRLRYAVYKEIEGSGGSTLVGDDDAIGFSFGPVIGLNIHLPEVVSFSLTTGVMAGIYDDDYWPFSSEEVESTGYYYNLSVIFRIGDNY